MFRQMVILAIAGIISSSAWASGATFRGIGPMYVRAISANGTTVVGGNSRWTEATGIVNLGTLPGADESFSNAESVSADGSVIVGEALLLNGYVRLEPFKWTEATGKVHLDSMLLDGMSNHGMAKSVSADGSTIVGYGSGYTPFAYIINPVRWTEPNNQAIGIPSYPATMFYAVNFGFADDTSADGSVIVGTGYAYSPGDENYVLSEQVFRWTEADGMVGLGYLSGHHDPTYGVPANTAVSADGNVIVGKSGSQAFRWTQDTGVVIIGNGAAYDVSADGGIIVGSNGGEAFIWDANHGMANLKEVLQNTYGLDINGWTLTEATGITPDGHIIVGNGKDPNNQDQGWIVNVGEPATLTILAEPNSIGINTISPGVGQHIYHSFWPISLHAGVYTECPTVYRFSHWIGDVSDPNSANATIVMNANKTVTAVYYAIERTCGDECHPILQGDLNGDCRINFDDFVLYCAHWLICTHPDCD